MLIKIARDHKGLGKFSANLAATLILEQLQRQPRVRVVFATGASQFELLQALAQFPGIDWSRIDGFHLDEYLGLVRSHPASFCRYLAERFVDRVPIGSFHYLVGDADPATTIAEATDAWRRAPIDLALIGIGENGHLAFNDPPADFQTKDIYHIVSLDEACRQQQVGEGWFPSLNACPQQAISMTIHGILESKRIICSVPDQRKAVAVRNAVDGPLTPEVPASILREHAATTLVLDEAAASLLSPATLATAERV